MRILGGFLIVFGVLLFVLMFGLAIFWSYQFDKSCGDWLKLAGDTVSVERADEFIGKAIGYAEAQGLTQGNSALIFKKQTTDLGIWYRQLLDAKKLSAETVARIQTDPKSVSELERTNILMKIREMVIDQGQAVSVTLPPWISWYPNQWPIALTWIASIIIFIIGLLILIFE